MSNVTTYIPASAKSALFEVRIMLTFVACRTQIYNLLKYDGHSNQQNNPTVAVGTEIVYNVPEVAYISTPMFIVPYRTKI